MQSKSEGYILEDREVRKQGIVLVNYAEAPFFRRKARHISAHDQDAPAVGSMNAGDGFKKDCFACPCGAEKGKKGPRFDMKRDFPKAKLTQL